MAASENLLRIQATILGTLLKNPGQMGEVAAELSPDHFDKAFTRPIYEAMCRLHFAGAPIEEATLVHELGDDNAEAVAEVARHSTAELKYYCQMLREQGRLEDLQAEALNIVYAQDVQQAGDSLDRLNGLMADKRSAKIVSAADAASNFFDRIGSDEKPEYLPWGLSALDNMLYAERGDFIVVGGYPSAGKTLLSLQFALAMAHKSRVGYFSLETSTGKLTERILSHMSRVPLAKIKTRDLGEADWLSLTRAGESLHKLPLELIDAGGMTVRDIRAISLNRRYQVIFVDYLQLINAKGNSRYEQVTAISQELHTLARANNIAVIALAQLSRPEKVKTKNKDNPEQSNPVPPSMSSFRESGQIEQDADVALLLYPSDLNNNKSTRILKIGKNKEGGRDKFELDFDGAIQTMTLTKNEKYRAIMAYTKAGTITAQRNAHRNSLADAPEELEDQMTFTDLPDGEGGDLPF